MINSIKQTPTISQHKRSLNSISSSKPSVSMTACVNKNGIIKREPAEINFCWFFKPEKAERLFKNKNFQKVLKFANDQQLVFGAGFSLLLTCILRPASIVLLPSKKNKDDQKYASAHSIASGVIGFAISTILFMPVSNAIKKIKENPEVFITNKKSYLQNKEMKEIAMKYIDRIPDIVTAVPKGILTIALIPPILKYVFGMEKKKAQKGNQKAQTPVDYSLLNFKSTDNQKNIAPQSSKGGVK